MPNHQVLISIKATGPIASGKSLAIADMLEGLRIADHFVIESQQAQEGLCEEERQVFITLKDQWSMD